MFLGTVKYTDVNSDVKIIKKRSDVYFGSSMHFFKTIIDNSWSPKAFILYEGKFSVNANHYFNVVKSNDLYEVIVSPTIKPELNLGSIKSDGFYADFSLLYNKKRQSRVVFKTKTFFIDNFGNNTHRDQIIFGGDIGQQKVGNTLPLDFEPKVVVKN